jgi:hypothetical protein
MDRLSRSTKSPARRTMAQFRCWINERAPQRTDRVTRMTELFRYLIGATLAMTLVAPGASGQTSEVERDFLNSCPDVTFPSEPSAQRQLFADFHAGRFELNDRCLAPAVIALLPAFESEAPADDQFELAAFALVRSRAGAMACNGHWWELSRSIDRHFLWSYRSGLKLRVETNRRRLADAISAVLSDPQTFIVPWQDCPNGPVSSPRREEVEMNLTPLIASLPDVRSVGVFTTWGEFPGRAFELGIEEEYYARAPGFRRTFLLRRGGQVRRLAESAGWSQADRINIYRSRDGKIGVMIHGLPRLIDEVEGVWLSTEGVDTDSWVYEGAFGFIQRRTSLGNLDGETGFIPTHFELECIPATEGDVLHRVYVQREQCGYPVHLASEAPFSHALAMTLADYLLEGPRQPLLPGIAVTRRIAPEGVAVEPSREFLFFNATSRDEVSNSPPGLAVLAIKVIGDGGDRSLAEAARRYALSGTPEFWAVDALGEHMIVHTDPREGRYARVIVLGPYESATTARVPWLNLSFDDLDRSRWEVVLSR